jgi:hypothetical protein
MSELEQAVVVVISHGKVEHLPGLLLATRKVMF